MSKERSSSSTITVAASSAIAASLATYILFQKRYSQKESRSDTLDTEEKLGPDQNPELQYELNLRGKVDKIYEFHGPKPFKFDGEVVAVFDDMVSRSVPLYCEVIDLAIYWFEKYYIPGTRVYDLGCSTGTTLDVLARACKTLHCNNGEKCEFIGIDNSEAMVAACQEKLKWATQDNVVDIRCGDILNAGISNSSFVIMNYTLQFVSVTRRQELLESIATGLNDGGVLLISEKVRAECSELQETCTWIYEDFKERRKYTKREIARKKEALMNVLIPYTEGELRSALITAGFETVEVIAKWNNFTSFVARKASGTATNAKSGKKKSQQKKAPASKIPTPDLDALFDTYPVYLDDYLDSKHLGIVCRHRMEIFGDKGFRAGSMSNASLESFNSIASSIQSLPQLDSQTFVVDQNQLILGSESELSAEQMAIFKKCIEALKPWKKGPLKLFGTDIDTEWRSDMKWERLQKALPNMKDKVVCDLGCGNGYFMYRMLEYSPKLVMGIDPNLHAWLEFNLFQRIKRVENVKFEYMRGDIMASLPSMFDVVFCLGVLYHTPDPLTMLKDIHKSMKPKSTLIVDCQGIPGDDDIALFPKKRYTNMKGVYFLPTLSTLKNWLQRANFRNFEVIFSEELSTDEQRTTEWAPVRSLADSLDPNDSTKTIEGYPRAHRFYIKCLR
ncbi:tRNA (mo5U34)-methyltransferase [Chaetoceros tenuissimus]|uniref:tRNA (Mo5U34)-methyltransferase n=2 Tax=Chaetoceros tenuissimus TaxID=426638 RepID=A0AAD3HD53_9STRA|nr:tRNA (mo5U34)-methyltransferase [Chaetoceros tenuissimus]